MSTSNPPPAPVSVTMARRLAHALRSPLWVIDVCLSEIGASTSAASDPLIEDRSARGRRSAGQLLEMANRFDWVARVQLPAEESLVDVQWPELIRSCVEARCIEAQARARKRKQVDVSIADAVGKGRTLYKASERALTELLDNAVRHAHTTVGITADVEGEHLRVRVSDDGTGLPGGGVDPFAPPPQVVPRSQHVDPRLGFGLWLVGRLAAMLQGSVGVERTGDDGTVMWLRIPVSARLDSAPAG